jgi:2-polyprenyl-3-methyl-5-hydroxy-6-metoxy-1,4-benzoquinol methylase
MPLRAVLPHLLAATGLDYKRCHHCGWLSRTHVPEHERSHYSSCYHDLTHHARRMPGREAPLSDALRRLGPPSGLLLDVGCAEGGFLELATDAGWSVEGLEISRLAAEQARKRTGAKIWTGSLESAELREQHYSVITLFNVLDQLSDPVLALKRCRELLKPEGRLLVRIPNGHVHGRLMQCGELHGKTGSRWLSVVTPLHLHVLNPLNMRRLAERCGYDDIVVRTGLPTTGDSYRFDGSALKYSVARLKRLYNGLARLLAKASFGKIVYSTSIELWAKRSDT